MAISNTSRLGTPGDNNYVRTMMMTNSNCSVIPRTRFIGFKKCIDRIIQNFSLLKEFFENESDPP